LSNLEDISSIGVIDIKTHKLVATWKLTGCDEPTGLGFDPKNHRLFSACDNEVMAVTDSQTGQSGYHESDWCRRRRRRVRPRHRLRVSPRTARTAP
jgi:hypothetical protein